MNERLNLWSRWFAGAGLAAVLFSGCTTADPKQSFEQAGSELTNRIGGSLRWMRNERDEYDVTRLVDGLLATNLTARSASAIALLNNRSLQAQFEEIGVSQADLAQASRLRNPVLAGSWRTPLDGVKAVNADYGLSQDILDLLTLPARKKIAAQNLDAVRWRVANAVLAFNEEVLTAFYTQQARQQYAIRLALIVDVNEASADIAQRQFDAGNINSLELGTQKLAYTQSRLDLAKVTAELRVGREKLNRLLGLWGAQTAWRMDDELPPLPAVEPSLEDVEGAAVTRRFDLAAARSEVSAAAIALRLKQGTRYLPGVNLGFSAEREPGGGWVLGPSLDLEVPLFDQGQPQLARLASHYRQARRGFEALAINIRSEVREARDLLLAAREIAAYQWQSLLLQNRRLLAETLLQYNAMQIGNHGLLLAKQREQYAEQAAIEALRDYWVARVRLQTALGGGFTPPAPSDAVSSLRSEPSEQSHH